MQLTHVIAAGALLVLAAGCSAEGSQMERPAAGSGATVAKGGSIMSEDTFTGTVKAVTDNAFESGFITRDDGQRDLFFDHTGVAGPPLKEGDRVVFQVQTDERGTRAVMVRPL